MVGFAPPSKPVTLTLFKSAVSDQIGTTSLYYSWSKEFLEAGKKRLAGDTAREASTGEVKELRREARDLKEVVAEQALEIRLLKKSMTGDGGELA